MFKTVATIRILTLLSALSLPASVLASDIACTVAGSNPYCGGTGTTVNYNGSAVTFNPGNTFIVELSDASGSFAAPVTIGSSAGTSQTGTIAITFPNNASGTGYRVRVTATNPSIPAPADNGLNLIINPANNISVSINTASTVLCDTNSATFNATPVGVGPFTYSWTENGLPAGTNSASYPSASISDGDQVKVTMTSAEACSLPASAESNTITMTQLATVTPSVTATPPALVCQNTNAMFTATPVNGGTTPSYQWKRNGNPVGTNSDTFVTNTLNTGDAILVEMTTSRYCVSQDVVTSNSLNLTVASVVTPAITITPDPATTVGVNSVIYVSSEITNGGTAPVYQWTRNGTPAGSSNVLVVPNAQDDDEIVATMTSNANCAQPVTAVSTTLTLDVDPNFTQSNHSWGERANQTISGTAITRVNGSGFSVAITGKGYVGLGYVGTTSNLRNDFWEYDPANDVWTQKANFIGAPRYNAVGFSAGNKGYIGMGLTAGGAVKDLYQYDPTTNSWISRASLPAAAKEREQAFAFGIGSKGYVGGGYSSTFGDLDDFYEFDQASNTWTQKANYAGGKRLGAAAFSIDALSKGFAGGGYSTSTSSYYKDFWRYDPTVNQWNQLADMPGERTRATGFALAGNGYLGLGYGATGFEGQLYQYKAANDTWTARPYYPGPSTSNGAVGMSIGNRAFVYKDGTMYEYNLFTTTSFSSKICTSETIPISFDASGFAFLTNNVFTAQMSKQQNFAVTTTLGTITSGASSGIVNAVFPSNVAAGNYYVRIVSSNPQLSTLLEPITLTVIPASHSVTAPGGASVCTGVEVTFNSNLTTPGLQWYKNNDPVGTDDATYLDSTLINADVIKAIKTYTAGCSKPVDVNSNVIVMTVRTPPTPKVTVTQPNTLNSSTALQYQWYKDNIIINNANGQTYVMTQSGSYKVRTTDSGGCLAFSDNLINAFTGLYDEEIAGQVIAYPNPVKTEMVLEIADDLVTQGVDYSVLNELGQPLFAPLKASRSNKINFTGRAAGLYLVRLSVNGSTIIRRVIKVD